MPPCSCLTRPGPRKRAQPGPAAQPRLPSDSEGASFSARAALAQNGPTDIFQVPVLELRARPLSEARAAARQCTNLAGPETKSRFLFEVALDDLAFEERAVLARAAAVVVAPVGVHEGGAPVALLCALFLLAVQLKRRDAQLTGKSGRRRSNSANSSHASTFSHGSALTTCMNSLQDLK